MKWLISIILITAAAMGGAYWWAGKDEVTLTEADRAKAPGAFVDLTDGKMHYVVRGPESGPTIVMVHGFSTPHFIYEQNASSLAANGFRVIQFDHFGRGWSDRPSTKYDADFYDRALLELLEALNIQEPIGLVGMSMGGVITAEFTKRHPERVARLFLLVPTGLDVNGGDSLQMKLTRAPVIGDWIWRVWGKQVLLGDRQYDEEVLPEMNRLQGDVTEQMNYKGYFPALLSTMRHLEMSGREDVFEALGASNIPVMAVFGENDTTIPVAAAERMRTLMPSADVRILYDNPDKEADADHGLNYKEFEIINPWLVEFFTPMIGQPAPAPVTNAAAEPG